MIKRQQKTLESVIMPLKQFTCPDGVNIDVDDCLTQCRMDRRCLTLPTLVNISDDRRWDGTPHVTDLLNGTMYTYLQITESYAIDPRDRAFSLLGVAHHEQLEQTAKELGLPAELEFHYEGEIQGRVDFLDEEPSDPNSYVLVDYKTWGSYKVAKALGLRRYKDKGGKWQVEYKKDAVDMREAELQLNKYRIAIEAKGYDINRMIIQATVRDGNTQIARQRGVVLPMYLIPVRHLPDEIVNNFFQLKAKLLHMALSGNAEPVLCTTEERWNDVRCKNYCEVAQQCPHGKLVQTGLTSSNKATTNRGR